MDENRSGTKFYLSSENGVRVHKNFILFLKSGVNKNWTDSFVEFSGVSYRKYYPISENLSDVYFNFLTLNRFVFGVNCFHLLKYIIRMGVNQAVYMRPENPTEDKFFFILFFTKIFCIFVTHAAFDNWIYSNDFLSNNTHHEKSLFFNVLVLLPGCSSFCKTDFTGNIEW